MAACGPDILSLCHSVDLEEGVRRAGTNFAYQGNIDSGVLFGSREAITSRVRETAQQAQRAGVRHILNLGHGIMQVGGEVAECTVIVMRSAGQCECAVFAVWPAGMGKVHSESGEYPDVEVMEYQSIGTLVNRPLLCRARQRMLWRTCSMRPRTCNFDLIGRLPVRPGEPDRFLADRLRPRQGLPLPSLAWQRVNKIMSTEQGAKEG